MNDNVENTVVAVEPTVLEEIVEAGHGEATPTEATIFVEA